MSFPVHTILTYILKHQYPFIRIKILMTSRWLTIHTILNSTRERLFNNSINIKFERDRYTIPITIKFRQQKDNGSINAAKIHRDVFAEMLLIDSTTKIITNNGDTFINSKELSLGKVYTNTFTEATINNQKYNSVKA